MLMEWPVLVGKVMLGLDLDERSLWLSDWLAGRLLRTRSWRIVVKLGKDNCG